MDYFLEPIKDRIRSFVAPGVERLYYGRKSLQFADLYLPNGEGPHPVAILIHGGFWRTPYSLSLMNGIAKSLAYRGIAAWNIEYRRVGDEGGGWPGTLLDVAFATEYLPLISTTRQLDLGRVIALGHSAGGHLALWLAARPRLPEDTSLATNHAPPTLTGAVSLSGAIDLEQVWQLNLGNGAAAELLGGNPSEVPERYSLSSPAALLPLGTPQVLIHGTSDDRVPIEVSRDYAEKAKEAGDTVDLIELPGVDHFALIDARSTAWTTTLREVQKLLHVGE